MLQENKVRKLARKNSYNVNALQLHGAYVRAYGCVCLCVCVCVQVPARVLFVFVCIYICL